MTPTTDHIEVSGHFILKADEYLAQGDLLQASEKAWGATARQVKAVAQRRGWGHQRHGQLFGVIDAIASETGRPEINGLFHVANGLHANFYEGWLTTAQVADGIADVKRLLALLEPHTAGQEVIR